ETGVDIHSICADYFMEMPFTSKDYSAVETSLFYLKYLIQIASMLKIKEIVIPCVDQSSLKSTYEQDKFIETIQDAVKLAEHLSVHLALETDLPPLEFKRLLQKCSSTAVTVNYDIGNSAALGFQPKEELQAYGNKITDIHIKDRKLNGSSIILGQGNANFDSFFEELLHYKYTGIFILQAYRDEDGIEVFKQQLDWISDKLDSYEKRLLKI
ncbi:MAG: sugar phosphate isomerase/epimerase, partial [Silvanigrellaceae bacterium]|nr:sugar phosphate isomerase/epimerase [Silvanigrellaceae bacterium]